MFIVSTRNALAIMAKPYKTKAHHSFLRNDALKCNVGKFQKTGTNAQGEHCKNKLAYFYN